MCVTFGYVPQLDSPVCAACSENSVGRRPSDGVHLALVRVLQRGGVDVTLHSSDSS